MSSCNGPGDNKEKTAVYPSSTDAELAAFISHIKAVDNHAHPNTINPGDKGSDALPLDVLGDIELPVRVRPGSPEWLAAYKGLYGFTGTDLNDKTKKELQATMDSMLKEKGDKFPSWVLDQCGTEIMFANRLYMGAGLTNSRFRWVIYADALLFPLSTKSEGTTSDQSKLFPLEDQRMAEFLSALTISKLPATLDDYMKQVVTAVLEMQKKGGCVAVKFEAAYLRSLDFEKADIQSARKIYSQYVGGAIPPHAEYKLLQDFLFHYIASEAGRLGLAVHIHSFPAAGNYFVAAGSDPILLETMFNDPELRQTKFVLIHGGGPFAAHTSAMLWKPNVYADISLLTQLWTADEVAIVLREYLSQFPEKILFGSDAVSFGPGMGWELSAWIATTTGRQALGIALSAMMRSNEISRSRAEEIATMVMRGNADSLYHLGLH
jgi:predicted TIM-barrel fold metal-dependent hydrolase